MKTFREVGTGHEKILRNQNKRWMFGPDGAAQPCWGRVGGGDIILPSTPHL